MEDDSVNYNGLTIKKAFFRVFVYGYENQEKITNNWDDYQAALETGLWFSSRELVPILEKRTRKREVSA